MEKIEIGKVVNVVGIKGEIKVLNYSETPGRYSGLEKIFIGKGVYHVEKAREKGNTVVIKLEEINDRDGAELMRGSRVFMDAAELGELPEGTYYIRDLIGMAAVDAATGENVGTLRDVLTDRPQDIYVLDIGGRECMVPAVREFVKKIDPVKREITFSFIEGMIDQRKK
ncbi:MAG: ribosome maturation factor RimM [Anaerovoracaceae bacterium]